MGSTQRFAVQPKDQEEVAPVLCVGVAPRLKPGRSLIEATVPGTGLELVVLEGTRDGLLEPRVWRALSWAAFSGRVAAVVGDSPMRTWNAVHTDESTSVRLRSEAHPWGEPGLTSSLQAKVEDDTLLGVMPMWLWTLASIAKKEGVPFCQTCALQGSSGCNPWLQQVVKPFVTWSNSSEFVVQGVNEGVRQTKPFKVCTNLGFSRSGVRASPAATKVEGVPLDPTWPVDFKNELSLALFGLATPQQAEEEPTAVKVVEAAESFLLSDPTRPSGPVSFKPPAPEVQAAEGVRPKEGEPERPDGVSDESQLPRGVNEDQRAQGGSGQGVGASSGGPQGRG